MQHFSMTKPIRLVLLFALVASLLLSGRTPAAQAATDDNVADAVLGQTNFTDVAKNSNGSDTANAGGFTAPYEMAIDPRSGRVYVADYPNHRVLSWPDSGSFGNGADADIVIGQPNFIGHSANQGGGPGAKTLKGPVGVAVDARTGALYVSDYGNHRVLRYDAPLTTEASADEVYGQDGSFTTNTANKGGISLASLNFPWGVAVDQAGYLYVADYGNHRVLIFAPNGLAHPTRLLGQTNVLGNAANNGGAISSAGLDGPTGIAVHGYHDKDGSTLRVAVADTGNHRVLVFDPFTIPIETGKNALHVFGQGSDANQFTTGIANKGGISALSLHTPHSVAFDTAENLYVADSGNHRVLRFNVGPTVDTTADAVFGQANYGLNAAGTGNNHFNSPYAVAVDPHQHLFVADRANHRVLRFDRPAKQPVPTLLGTSVEQVAIDSNAFTLTLYGKGFVKGSVVRVANVERPTTFLSTTHLETSFAASELTVPYFAWLNVSNPASGGGSSGSAYVSTYHRFTQDTQADRVLGQPTFATALPNPTNFGGVSAHRMERPSGIAIHPGSGRLYVADNGNNRVLSWPNASAYMNGMAADLVLGQPTFFTRAQNYGGVSASSLTLPMGVAVDTAGNVYVADTGNNRVLQYNSPTTSDTIADRVFGQPNFTSVNADAGGTSASSLDGPSGVALDKDDNLYIADSYNNRVLKYLTPLTSDRVADLVIGQANFSVDLANGGSTTASASSLQHPRHMVLDTAGNLYVVDSSNHRVLQYDAPLNTNAAAARVYGQPDLLSNTASNGGVGANSLQHPGSVAMDSSGNLYVADSYNNRVLEYDRPLNGGDTTADRIFGQTNTFSNQPNQQHTQPDAGTLYLPFSLALDAADNLYVSDTNNHRVLAYDAPMPSPLKQEQTITFDLPPSKTIGDAPFTVEASASSGLAVTFTGAGGACSVNGTTVTLSGQAGICPIVAHQNGDATYNAAPTLTRYLVINDPAKQDQTITFDPLPNKQIGDAPFEVHATASSGLPITWGYTGDCTASGATVTLHGKAGTCTIVAQQPGDAVYNVAPPIFRSFTITDAAKQNQTIAFFPLPDKQVGDAPFEIQAIASSGLAVSFTASGECTLNGTIVGLTTQVGSCTLTAHQGGDAVYNSAPDVSQTFQIRAAAGTVYQVYLPLVAR